VPEGTARLRVTLSALHRTEHIDGLVRTLLELMQ
jgi:7-keto-8-aminopelargonate synthetase-like enzyme